MVVLLDTSQKLSVAETELGFPVEQLLTPLTRFNRQKTDGYFAIDNGAFSKKGFQRPAFEALLNREFNNRDLCRFVAVPDVVGSARRTMEVFDYWFPLLAHWKLAFVCQDGQEDLPIPFEFIDAIFIGGSTAWKESSHAIACVRAARAIGKWTHIGRINSPDRFEAFLQIGADSCDGTGIAQYSKMRVKIRERNNNRLFPTSELVNVETAI